MSAKIKYIQGYRFPETRLRYICDVGHHDPRQAEFICDCGNSLITRIKSVKARLTISCGCYNREKFLALITTHGDSGTRLNNIYRDMLRRCTDKSRPDYKWYGGRGITVCDEWKNNYIEFKTWALSNGYADNLTIEREKIDKGYSPLNCTWIPEKLKDIDDDHSFIQGWNTSTVNICTIDGIEYPSISEASRQLSLTYGTVYYRCNSDNFPSYKRKLKNM